MRILKKTEIKSLAARSMIQVLGEARVTRQLLKRNYRYYQKTRAIFIHVPKVAGTTIASALYGKTLGHFRARELCVYDPQTFHDLFVFAFLRDPVERARSSYNYARSGGTAQGMVAYRKEYSGAMFSDFETFATQWLPRQSVDSVDLIFQPQSDFLLNKDGELLANKVYCLERIEDAWKDVSKNCAPIHAQLKNKNVNSNSTLAHKPLCAEARQALEKYYRKDLELWDTLS
ncbi:MAG TPA: hypothetical protein DD827_01695 [Gammaproteobacteria bacterium]|nr:hypothetical protein [Gammaproteobacteria bacterium]